MTPGINEFPFEEYWQAFAQLVRERRYPLVTPDTSKDWWFPENTCSHPWPKQPRNFYFFLGAQIEPDRENGIHTSHPIEVVFWVNGEQVPQLVRTLQQQEETIRPKLEPVDSYLVQKRTGGRYFTKSSCLVNPWARECWSLQHELLATWLAKYKEVLEPHIRGSLG